MGKIVYVLPLLADMGHALLTASLLGIYTKTPFSFTFLMWTLAWAFILDLDNVRQLIKGKIAATVEHPYDHRDGWHYPLPWVLCFVAVFALGGVTIWTLSAALGIFFHFVNDLFGTGWGVKLLWPFSKNNYKLFTTTNASKLVSSQSPLVQYTPEEMPHIIREQGNPHWIHDHYLQMSSLTLIEYGVFAAGLCALATWLYYL